jgi:Leucine-rich repeat (LRR) protein
MSISGKRQITIEPVISYPREAQIGKTYLMTIDLRIKTSYEAWPYESEEYPISFLLSTTPAFNSEPVGDGGSTVVLHRFGGTYGPAKFLLTAAQEEMTGTIQIVLRNQWGMPIEQFALECKIRKTDEVPSTKISYSVVLTSDGEIAESSTTKKRKEYDAQGKLIVLDLSNSDLKQLPAELEQLSDLQELNLSYNQLIQFPSELGQLTHLQRLDLRGNQLRELPAELEQLTNLQELYLNNNLLYELPAQLGQLIHLQELHVNNNQLHELPSQLGQLTNLKHLDLSSNLLRLLPAELGHLTNLQRLYLSNNRLREIPSELGQLISLQEFILNNNLLGELPASLGQLTNLQGLYLRGNQLGELPASLEQLINLQGLYLRDNQLSQLPPNVGRLTRLQRLYLDENQLQELPPELGQLTNLQELYLNKNRLRELPPKLGQLTSLQMLRLENNPELLTPPPEIVEQGTQATLAFLRELNKGTVRRRYEAKVILVGEAGTGKSSLLRAIQQKLFDPLLETTLGIEIETLTLPHPSLPSKPLVLNAWDFGGQDIYRATHQFFLTRRSLYLVAWNARIGVAQSKLDYWLNTISIFAPDCPVILVATHIDERAPDLNVPQYRADYPQIVDVLSVSSRTGADIDELKRTIAKHAAMLPLMGQPWPISWVEVERELVASSEYHINAHAYMDLCATKGVHVRLAQGTLGSYLHDLGKILYFHDDPVLRDIVLLKPNSIVKAINLVLEDKAMRDRSGILVHAELARIWAHDERGQRYDPALYPIFLRLMERFDLCYQIDPQLSWKHVTHSLIPQLLPYQPPSSLPAWTPEQLKAGKVHVEMTYHLDFVPAGIMSWFIVRTHRYTCNLHWREGVVLTYQDHFARIELLPRYNQLHIEAWGVEPRTFLVILKETMDLILSRFEGLQVRREVPCICYQHTEQEQACREAYRYEEDLVKRLNQGVETIQCRESFREVVVRDLLYGIHMSMAPQVQHTIVTAEQQEILRRLDVLQYNGDLLLSNTDVLLQRLNLLYEWNVRQFTRQWNFEMQKMEAECPNTFLLIPSSSRKRFNPKKSINQRYKLFLMCQYPSKPHCIHDAEGYDLHQTKDWWLKVLPWFKHLIKFLENSLENSVSINTEVSDLIPDREKYKQVNQQVELLKKIAEEVASSVEYDSTSLAERSQSGDFGQNVGPAFRALHSFLKEADPNTDWNGLQKVVTEDGNIFWLCEDHTRPYQVRRLLL